jgi:endo-1,4-beta-mannosidase
VFGPSCHDCLCYSNHLQRAPYDAAFTKAWCKEMSGTIKALDPTRRVTLGDLKASLQLTGPPSCAKEDGLDYYSLHVSTRYRSIELTESTVERHDSLLTARMILPQLYPHGNDTAAQLAEKWSQRIATLPDDGLPVIIEEMYPLGGSAPWSDILQVYINSTSPRTVGWMSFVSQVKQLPASYYSTSL